MADERTRQYWREAKQRQRAGQTTQRPKNLNDTVNDLIFRS